MLKKYMCTYKYVWTWNRVRHSLTKNVHTISPWCSCHLVILRKQQWTDSFILFCDTNLYEFINRMMTFEFTVGMHIFCEYSALWWTTDPLHYNFSTITIYQSKLFSQQTWKDSLDCHLPSSLYSFIGVVYNFKYQYKKNIKCTWLFPFFFSFSSSIPIRFQECNLTV